MDQSQLKQVISDFMDRLSSASSGNYASEILTDPAQYKRAVQDIEVLAHHYFDGIDLPSPTFYDQNPVTKIPTEKLRTWSSKCFNSTRQGHQCVATNTCRSIHDYLKHYV